MYLGLCAFYAELKKIHSHSTSIDMHFHTFRHSYISLYNFQKWKAFERETTRKKIWKENNIFIVDREWVAREKIGFWIAIKAPNMCRVQLKFSWDLDYLFIFESIFRLTFGIIIKLPLLFLSIKCSYHSNEMCVANAIKIINFSFASLRTKYNMWADTADYAQIVWKDHLKGKKRC